MKSYRCIVICLLLGAESGFAAQAGVVHKWVDADGTTHYSDEAPTDAQLQVNRIEIDESEQAAVKSTDDYYSIANQWKRMHRERLERDRIALEKARLRASKQVVERVVVQQPATETRYLVDHRRRHYPWHRHKKPARKPVSTTRWPPGLHPGRNRSVGSYKYLP